MEMDKNAASESKPLALLYVRVSTNRQAKTGHSVDTQPAILTEAAERDGYQVEIITEVGSGRKAGRPLLNEALGRLARGEAHALYSLDTDRLARSTIHLLEIANHSLKENWRLVITTANVDTSTPAGEAFLTMAAAFAQFETRMISERVKRQHQARRDRGEIWGITSGAKSKLPVKTRRLIIKLRSEGLSLAKIGEHLTAKGYKTVRGGPWYDAGILQILRAPASDRLREKEAA
jgi:DNA invertase Pin-like site-specific DNA recombinase